MYTVGWRIPEILEYIGCDQKTKQFLNISQLHNAELHHALEVDSISDETDSDEDHKQKRERVPGITMIIMLKILS